MAGLMLTDDLIFLSRVAGTARALGLSVKQARSPAAVLELAGREAPAALILDLHHNGLDLPALLAALPVRPRVIAYGSHVEAETLRAARKAGCDLVLPRSEFVARLESDLPAWLA